MRKVFINKLSDFNQSYLMWIIYIYIWIREKKVN